MKPMIVLLPGMDGTGDLLAPITAVLAGDAESIIIRYPHEPLDYSAHEAIARASLSLERPYVFLGESFSGPMAISVAASHPANLAGFVLCASLSFPRRSAWEASRKTSDEMDADALTLGAPDEPTPSEPIR
jgi:pimeloyl-ACP methyl ester carboxylesterase